MDYFECSECQGVLHCEHAPAVCPHCGLVAEFCRIDETAVEEHYANEDLYPLEIEFVPAEEGWVRAFW